MAEQKKAFLLFLNATLFVCILVCVLSCVACASEWSQFQKDTMNSGLTNDEAPVSDPLNGTSLTWETQLSSGIDITPIVYEDFVYVATGDKKVRCIDKTTGDILWENTSSGNGFLLANIAYGKGMGRGMIFVPTKDGKIFAFDAETGVEMWNVKVSNNQLNTPVTYDDNRIFFGDCVTGGAVSSSDGTYYCYNAEDGTKVWSRNSTSGGGYYWAGATVKGDYLVYGDDNSHLVSVEKETGNTIDEIDISTVYGVDAKEIRSSIVFNSENLYFTSKGGYCFALGFNESTGQFDTTNVCKGHIGTSVSTPAVYNGKVYAGSAGGLFCLNASDLTEIWNFTVSGNVKSSPALSNHYDTGNGTVYIYFTTNAEDGMVYCLEDHDENSDPLVQWSYGDPGKTDWSLAGVAISDGWVYYGTDTGYLFGLTDKEAALDNGESNSVKSDSSGIFSVLEKLWEQIFHS